MYYLFDDLIIIKNLDANNVKINEKLYKNISAYCTGFETGTRVQYLQVFYQFKESENIEEHNEHRYSKLVQEKCMYKVWTTIE